MKFFFITALINIEIPDDLGQGERIYDAVFITNQSSAISKYLTPGFEKIAGTMETNFIRHARACVYAVEERPDNTNPQDYLLEKLATVTSFLNSLWLVKDNAVNNNLGFVKYIRKGQERLDSNSHAIKFSTAKGVEVQAKFTRRELWEARQMFREWIGLSRFVEPGSAATLSTSLRLDRAIYFMTGARSSNDIGLKIANYCSALEALFSSNQSELTHQLSERVAAFLEDKPHQRVELYYLTKKAYSIRSTVVHGGFTSSSKADDFIMASTNLDNVLRRIFVKIFKEQISKALINLQPAVFNKDFLLRVFGAMWEDLIDDEAG